MTAPTVKQTVELLIRQIMPPGAHLGAYHRTFCRRTSASVLGRDRRAGEVDGCKGRSSSSRGCAYSTDCKDKVAPTVEQTVEVLIRFSTGSSRSEFLMGFCEQIVVQCVKLWSCADFAELICLDCAARHPLSMCASVCLSQRGLK